MSETLFQYPLIQDSDENKRQVLGDLLYKIRFPTMLLEDFVEEVANCDILNDQELRILFTHLAGGTPKSSMPFLDQSRGGPYQEVRFKDVRLEKFNVNLPDGVCCSVKIEELRYSYALEMSEIHFSNPADFPFDVLQVVDKKADEILKIPGEEFNKFPVYKAVFKKPLLLTSNFHIYLKTSTYSGKAPSTRIVSDHNSTYRKININTKSCSLRMEHDSKYATAKKEFNARCITDAERKDSRSWHFFVGFKGRIVKVNT